MAKINKEQKNLSTATFITYDGWNEWCTGGNWKVWPGFNRSFYWLALKLFKKLYKNLWQSTTIAITRHPFLRLYSAYSGFFTSNVNPQDYSFAKYWMGHDQSMKKLMQKYPNVAQNMRSGKQVDLMTWEQFIESIIIHLDSIKDVTSLRWRNEGAAHINPQFAILKPCQYKFKYCKFFEKKKYCHTNFLQTWKSNIWAMKHGNSLIHCHLTCLISI